MNNKIFILGNGLDLNLGLNTRYSDFLNWIKKEDSKYFESVDKKNINNNKNIWIQFYLTQNIGDDYCWFDFEEDVARILNNSKIDKINNLGEKDLRDFWIEEKSGKHLDNFNYPKVIQNKIKNDWQNLNDLFLKYLNSDHFIKNTILSFSYSENNFYVNQMQNNFFVFNFNFTNIIDIPEEKIYFLNGTLEDGILGSDNVMNPKFSELTKKHRNILEKRKTDKNIKENLEKVFNYYYEIEIVIIGHSISETDWELYKEIIKKDRYNLKILWKIYFCKKEDKSKKWDNLCKMNFDYFNKKYNNNLIQWIKIENRNYINEFPKFISSSSQKYLKGEI